VNTNNTADRSLSFKSKNSKREVRSLRKFFPLPLRSPPCVWMRWVSTEPTWVSTRRLSLVRLHVPHLDSLVLVFTGQWRSVWDPCHRLDPVFVMRWVNTRTNSDNGRKLEGGKKSHQSECPLRVEFTFPLCSSHSLMSLLLLPLGNMVPSMFQEQSWQSPSSKTSSDIQKCQPSLRATSWLFDRSWGLSASVNRGFVVVVYLQQNKKKAKAEGVQKCHWNCDEYERR